ncbi:MAG: hypothetical protein IJP10_03800 [Clostridia bacterium]|nr:hypothetical protein [Oscillospiraceae bacterium]MBQ6797119.1 hypothetical protein [Clostridia bacterium]
MNPFCVNGGECSGCGECIRREKEFGECELCGQAICSGEEYFNLCGEVLCADCVEMCRRTAGEAS